MIRTFLDLIVYFVVQPRHPRKESRLKRLNIELELLHVAVVDPESESAMHAPPVGRVLQNVRER